MADNTYVYESYPTSLFPMATVTDDGTGTDWIVIDGEYDNRTIVLSGTDLLGTFIGQAQITYTIYSNGTLSTVYFTVSGAIENARGGAGDEFIQGSLLANLLQGDQLDVAGGSDTIYGELGNDTVVGAGGSDSLFGGGNDDLIFGDVDPFSAEETNYSIGSDSLYGGSGNDRLYGGWGDNLLDGGTGTDTADYSGFFDDFGTTTFRIIADIGTGQVQVWARDTFGGTESLIATDTLSAIERVIGTAGNDSLTASESYDPLTDTLDPILLGGAGNDVLRGGPVRDALYGGDGDDTLIGFFGTVVDGGGVMEGGKGNDTYYLNGPEAVSEAANGGYDTVISYGDHTLAANVERLLLDSTAKNGTGNDLGNQIFGNLSANLLSGLAGLDIIRGKGGHDSLHGDSGNDSLYGEGGNDRLYGEDDNDSLLGSDGRDTLVGGGGRDILLGGNGADRFLFQSVEESAASSQRDLIRDFASGLDKIDLKAVITDGSYIGGRAFSGSGGAEVRYASVSGILWADTDGDGTANLSIALGAGTLLVSTDVLL